MAPKKMTQKLSGNNISDNLTISSKCLPAIRSRGWIFTINNYTDNQVELVKNMLSGFTYGIYALEVGDSGTPHIQGYLYHNSAITFTSVCKKLTEKVKKSKVKNDTEVPNDTEVKNSEDMIVGEPTQEIQSSDKGEISIEYVDEVDPEIEYKHKAWISKAKGTAEQNRSYIQGPYTKGKKSKPFNESAIEYGEIPVGQGTRTDLEEVKNMILEGKLSRDDLVVEHTDLENKYGRTLDKLYSIRDKRLTPKKKIYDSSSFNIPPIDWSTITEEGSPDYGRTIILVGPACIGKTQYAKSQFKNPLLVSTLNTLGEFDFIVHDGIIFDDMNFSSILSREQQIHLLDWEEMRSFKVLYKYANIPPFTRKIICSNLEADIIFDTKRLNKDKTKSEDEAITRRFKEIILTSKLY